MSRLTPHQAKLLLQLAQREVSMDDPGVREAIGHLTADDLEDHAKQMDAQMKRFEALDQAGRETVELMREHGVETAGELRRLGIASPFEEVAARIVRAHAEGELTDDELRELGIGEIDGELVIDISPTGTPKYTGEG